MFKEAQVTQLTDILKDNINKLSRETKEQLTVMKRGRPSLDILEDRLETVAEFETTGKYRLLNFRFYLTKDLSEKNTHSWFMSEKL